MAAMLACQGTKLSDKEKQIFSKHNPVGINLFARNIEDCDQTKALVQDIKETIGRDDVLIAVDQEGGRVRRLVEPQFRSYAAAINLGSLPLKQALRASQLHALLISHDLQELGINVNYAPVLDISYPETNPVIKSRCFSSDAKIIAQLGKSMVDEYKKNGILPCIKHLPGHGRAKVDPHLSLPIINEKIADLANDFYPFQINKNSPLGMTAHIIINDVDPNNPITQSSAGIKKIIRQEIDFDGFLISDAIDMHALHGSLAEKTLKSLQAGCDCICYSFGKMSELKEITSICPTLTDAAQQRFYQATKILKKQPKFADIDILAEEYKDLIGLVPAYQDSYDATEILHQMQERK